MPTEKRNYRKECGSVLPLVAQVAWRYYGRLPNYAKAFIDVEDLIQQGILSLQSTKKPWNPDRGAYTTFVQVVVQTNLGKYIDKLLTDKRRNDPVSLSDELSGTVLLKLGTAEVAYEDFADFDAYCEVYGRASDQAKVFLGSFVGVPPGASAPRRKMKNFQPSRCSPKVFEELRGLCLAHQVSYTGLLRLSRGGLSAR